MPKPDDDNGYTTSEDQGERADTLLDNSTSNVNARASTSPLQPQVIGQALPSSPEAKTPFSASTQTGLVPSEPSTPAVERGTQCTGSPGVDGGTLSTKVYTRLPRILPKGTQCAELGSVRTVCRGAQCSLLVSLPGEGVRSSMAEDAFTEDLSQEQSSQAVDVQPKDALSAEEAPEEDVPTEGIPGEGQRSWTVATVERKGWVGAWRQEGRQANASGGEKNNDSVQCPGSVSVKEAAASAKVKKKRKKGKSAGVKGCTNEDLCAAGFSEGVMITRSITSSRPEKRAWIWIAALLGVLSLVLVGTWGGTRISGEPRKGVGVVGVGYESSSPSVVQPFAKEDRSQPPMWVVVGGSLTLGDVFVSSRAFGRADNPESFQWYKDGNPILGQNR